MKKSAFLSNILQKPWVRAQLCASAIGGILFVGSAAYAAHRAKTTALQLGSEIMTNVSPTSNADALSFNGAHFRFSSEVLNAKIEDVIAGAEAICSKEGRDLEQDLMPSLEKIPFQASGVGALASQLDVSKLLTVTTQSGKSGEVACWVRRGNGPKKNVLDRVKTLTESLDFSELGSLQFIHAEEHNGKTLVRALWSDGPLKMNDFFPEKADVPGHDLADLPRPPGSQRIIAGHIEGADRHILGYASPEPPWQVNAFYAAELPKHGWKEIDLGEKSSSNQPLLEHAYEKDGHHALLALSPSEDSTGATWIEFGQ